jgi:amino acid adenylation domain-containing protein
MDRKNVEDLYPLSPLQQGMLFHTLYSPGSGAYVEQTVLVLAGRPRAAELRRAWELVTERHPILRTGFVWEGVPKPLQVVFRKVDLPFVTEDWSGLPAEEREARYQRFMADDRARGFDLLRAPLMRFALIRTAPDEHRLVWTSHHVLTDGWSLPLVLNDFIALYDGLLRGAPPRLRPVRPFREYIAWLNRQDAAAAERYWRARLADWEAPTPLPLDRAPARAGQPARDHAIAELLLPPDAVAALDDAARRMRVTASAILQGAWATVLARMTAAEDVVFGTTVSGRPPELPGVQEMVGMFINTIPVRVRMDDGAEAGDWLRGIHRAHAAAGEFEHAPLADVQKWAGARADAGLFETLLVYENYPIPMGGDDEDDGPQPDGALELVGMEGTERTDLPLSLAVAPAPGGMRLSATFDQGRLHADDARRILAGLSEVIGQITGGTAVRVAELSPFTDDERRRPLACWSGRVVPPVRETIPSLFRAAASASPHAVAVRAEDATLTYAQLDAAANRLAHHLRALGVGMDGRVGVSMERSSRLVVALLGVLKAGAAYVPLDPTYPPERLDYMRRDSGTELVLVDADAPAWAAGARVVSLAADAAEIDAQSAADPGLAYDPEALSYVMYTSGSTGTPKGVAVPHRAVARLVRGSDFARFGADETFLLLAPVAFDASTFEVWGALLNGGTLAVHPPEVPDPARLGAFLRARGVTTLWLSAGLFHQVADADPAAFAGVRQLLAGGDTVSPAHVRRVLDACPELRVIDGYGPTENTTFTACHTVRAEDLERGAIPVGRPVAGTQAYVVDARMRPLPAGVPGELYAGGTGLARGYLGRPALTAQLFVPDPFSGVPGARLYRTGDRARWLDDGTLEFGGRLDQQVKIRGFRIEPGEIEAALRAHPQVGDAVVDARTDGAAGRRLVAYVIPRDGAAPSAAEMRDALAGRLPAHMVPSAFVVLDALPLTPNGKVDRRALPEPETEAGAGPAPRTPTEEVLAGLWSEVLGIALPGRDDDFFHLGGHSLLATRLASRIRQAFAVEVPLRAVFEAPTLAAMAERVDGALRGAAGVAFPPVTAVGGNDLPLSFSQERLWFFDRLEPGNSVYNIPFPTRLVGALDVDALRRALGEIVRRHETLRTNFVEVDGRVVQRIHPPQDVPLPVDDLSMLAEDAREAELLRRLEAWTRLPYDLARDPLLRAGLVRLADDEHVLLGAMHHIVSDGWSMGVFWRELAVLYEAFAAGRPSPLPPLALQYGDVAVWQRRYLDGETVQRQVEWWHERMKGAPALLELPTDRPRPAIQSYRGALLPVVLPAELAEGARGVARGQGATLFMALVAAWSALLGRWAGQDDVVVGMPIAGRTQRETEELIGLFVNTLPIRARLDGDPSFRALLGRVREATLGAYAHQDLPYDRLVEELRPGRSLAHASLYQVMLAFNNTTGGEALDLPGLRLEGVAEAGGVARLDLTLSLAPAADGGLHGTLEYATDLFDAATAARLVRHLETLLAAAVAQPDAPLSSLPLLSEDEQARLAAWNATERDYAPGFVHRAIERQAMETPDAVALTFEGAHVTYADLDRRASHLAHRLRRAGVGPEARVGLMLERSPEMVISILAVLKAGGAYVPLDPGYPAERLAYMLADARVAVLLTHSNLAHLAGDYAGPVLRLDALEDDLRSEANAIPYSLFPIPSPEGLAYVIYTSGSTGRPKGAMNAHRGIWNRVVWMQDEYGLDASDVVLQKTPFSFDVSVWEFLWPLTAGARMVLARPGAHGDPAYLADLIRAEGVTTLHFVPSMLQAFLEAPALAERCASVRRVMASGEALPADLVARFHARMPSSTRLHNLYGPTEAAVDVTYWPCAADDARASIPIGRPVANTRIHVLDRRGAPAPVGVPGELHIAGVQVGRGYLDRPALTAEKFVPDPFSADPGARMYRTGDLARWLADGTLEYRGRMDHQVKVRGFRIELGEIEAALAAHPAVREAVVLARQDRPGDPRLVGYVVPAGGSVDLDDLRAGVRGRLPEYMVPSAFVVMADGFPLTPSGKADRRALPAPGAAEGAGFVAPRTPTEQVLAALWAGLLGVERVGAADEFFDLGGHSLLATRVVSAVRESFGVELPVRAVFEHPTLQALAAEVDRALRADGAAEAPPITPVPRDGGLPLSFAQERLWFVDRLEPGSPVYHMPLHYRLTGSLDADALRRALAEVVRRHESLRTSLPFTGEAPVQRIAASVDVELPIHDLRDVADEAERDAAAERLIGEVSNRAFDLERGPLFRAALVRMADDEHLLVVTLHHVIADGWSIGVLWSELSAIYTAFVEGQPSPLSELPVQYGDFAQWQRGWLTGDELERQLAYWRRRLAGAPPLLELPTDRPRPAVQTYVGAEAAIHLEGADAEAIRALGRREGSTLFMVLLAAMNVVFSRLAGQDDVVIGTPIAGRTRAETEGMIGLFLNSLALRTDLSGEPTFRQLLRRVREATLEAYAHQDLPFERILEELSPERSLSHSPLFQVMLNLANFGEGDVSLPGIEVQGIVTDAALASKFDLTLYAAEGPDAIGMYLVYNTALFDADRARIMLAQIVGVLRQAAEDAEQPIARLSLLTDDAFPVLPDPTAELSAEWRGSVPAIFAAHAARTPDALAVEDPRERWTYADLDADTTRIAHRLISDGVAPGDVVAILGHRSAALVRALIGTMKAGAAFLVLDPAYPPARLAEYVRIARPTGFLPLVAAGEVPAEVADALRETLVSTHPLDIRRVDSVDKEANSADTTQPPPAVLGEVASLSEPVGAPACGLESSEAESAPAVEIGPDSLAYLSFTSGTTGKPKAVMGRHGSLTHFTPWLAERFELGATDRFSLLSGLAHDPLHRDVFTPLQLGASVIAPDPDEVGTPGYLAQWMRAAGVTVAHLTPAMGQLLTTSSDEQTADVPHLSDAPRAQPHTQPPPAVLGEVASLGEPVGAPAAGAASSEAQPQFAERGGRGDGPSSTVDSLRRAFFVGDVLTRTDVARMHRLAPNLTVVNYYGSTETQRAVAHFVVPRDLSDLVKDIIPVGTGIPDVQVLIRNAAGERVGIGEVGEMWMRSPHIALGYLGDPELTAARFVANPWTGDAADPAYRTGDLGRYRPDGVAEIAGRADQQVKIRGFRIEPGEIEAALRAHSAIRDTVVVARGDADARRLVAYVVAEGDAPSSDALREWLRGSVPDYMVPSAWVFLPALPVTPNGKVDRKALPEPEADTARQFVAPRTQTEATLAEIWAGLMSVEQVGAEDDFFALGGHSLLATKLVARVRDRFGVELPLRTLFEAPVLAALAAQIDQRAGTERGPEAPPLIHIPHDGTAPASFAQERLWFVDRMEGGGAVYHIPTAQLLAGPVEPEAMRRAVEEVVRRHETLRTALPEVDGVPVQRISPPNRVEVPFIDLSGLAEEERDAEGARLAEQSANEPFDLEAGPLFRASLVRLSEDEHLLLVNLHHAIGDGWSMRVLLGEISTLHAAYLRGEPSPLPPLPIQYADYAAWQRAWLSGPVLDAQLGYWREALAGAPPLLHLPTDRPRPPVQGHRGASEALFLEPAEAVRVLALARGEGTTLFMVLLAALDVVLARWSGQQDVVIGTPVAGRTRSELEGLIGLFLNSLALRTDLSGDPSFRALLGRVRQATLQAYAHQDLPFERILEDLKPERSQAHTPVFQVMLNLLNYGDGGSAAPEGEMTSLGAGVQLASKFDITLYAAEMEGGISLHAVYDADLFDAARMRSLLAQIAGVLRQAADDADRPATALSLVTEEDRAVVDTDASPVVVRTRAGELAGIGELGEVWMRGPDGALRPMGGSGRYRPDGSVELATAPAPAPPTAVSAVVVPPSPRGTSGEGPTTTFSQTERAIAAIWGEVLGMAPERIAADADFFALGGHSLRATQVLSRIRARLGVALPIRAFFTTPTVAALASAVDAQVPPASIEASVSTETAEATSPAESALPHSRTDALPHSVADALPHSVADEPPAYPPGVYPLSFAQQRLWVLMQLGSTAAYHLASALRMTGELDEWALERALDELVRRHETLRTRIEVRDGTPVQVVQPPRPLRLRTEDVRPAADESVDDALRRMAEEEAARPFADGGPFLRVRLLRAADDDHVLLWTVHHLMADGWSLGIFQNEMLALYHAFVTDADSPLEPLRVQYGDHALAQRRELSGGALDALVGWWKDRLAGAPALLELPTDRPRPAQPSGEGSSFWFDFPEGTAARVAGLARARGATPFMVLLAAFQALLSRWSGQDDVVVATPIANRTRPELEPLIGFFANTLALRGDLSGDPTFDALLARVREATLGAYEHQDVPFERLVEALNPERSLSHGAIFQVMFALQNAPRAEGGAPLQGLTLSGLPRARETSQFDLFLAVHEFPDGLAARLEYATDLFDPASMERFAEQFVRLVDAALDTPDAPVAALPLMDDAQRRTLLDGFAGPRRPVPDAPLHGRFEAQARRTPDAEAVVFRDHALTYAQLDARANRLAHHLRARGAGPEVRVGICLERSVETVVAILAVLKACAAYLPLDPAYPADRLAYMLEDSGASLLVTQSSLGALLPAEEVRTVRVDDDAAAIAAEPAEAPRVRVDAGNVAYVIYTSGSTGRPKGVMVTHACAASFLEGMDDRVGGPVPGTWLAVTRISFDIHVLELVWTLGHGFRVVVQPEVEQAGEGESVAAQIRRHGVTHLQCTPSLAGMLVAESGAEGLRGLHRFILGGEALTPVLASRLAAVLPEGGLINMYGPTETTVWCTTHPVAADAEGVVPIGRPTANMRAYVLDPAGRLQPPGVPGELYLAGAGVTRGYLGRPALTAERFLPDPFGREPGARMYRTGDRARGRPDGALEYLGRTDFQVKVRGFRIELGEIEAALRQHPAVAEAVVVAVGQDQEARLVAYLTAAEGSAVPADAELRQRLSASMPDYMVPGAFVALESIPLTPSGKVDRRALPAPDAPAAGGYVVPRDVTELEVARIWSEALGVPRVGAADDFFRLGGHSLLALRMMTRIAERFGRELPLAALFRNPTVAAFAAALRHEGAGADDGRLLVTLNAGGALPPLFFLPPAGGTVTHYADLARHLGPEQPFLALHAPGLTGDEAPLESVEALAARYVAEIRAAQPHGPYWLGGWSAGGVPSFEAARQLRAAGEEVALVAIIDAAAPDGGQKTAPPDRVQLFRDFASGVVTEDEALLDALVAELRSLPEPEHLAALSRWIARHGGQVMDAELERVGRSLTVFAATARAVFAYRGPPPLDVPVALFVAAEGKPEKGMGPDLLPPRWRPFTTGELIVHVVPGPHLEMVLDPAAEVLGAQLSEVLRQVRGRRSS